MIYTRNFSPQKVNLRCINTAGKLGLDPLTTRYGPHILLRVNDASHVLLNGNVLLFLLLFLLLLLFFVLFVCFSSERKTNTGPDPYLWSNVNAPLDTTILRDVYKMTYGTPIRGNHLQVVSCVLNKSSEICC